MLQKYPKFKKDEECAYSERDNCNWDDELGSIRCEYMKCICMGNWHCIYKKEDKTKLNEVEINPIL